MAPSIGLEPPLDPTLVDRLQLQSGNIVADFGVGGSANWAVRMAQQVGGEGQVVMFDVRKAALTAALNMAKLNNVTNCKGVWSNLEIFRGARGIADQVFDAGIVVNMLNESKHPKDVLAEIHRMLKPQAKLFIIDWDPDTRHPLAPPQKQRLAGDYVDRLAKDIGLAPIEAFEPSPSYWALIMVRT